MPTFPNNSLNTAPVDIGGAMKPAGGKRKEYVPLDTTAMADGFEPVGAHVNIKEPDEFDLYEATVGAAGRGVQTSMIGTSIRAGQNNENSLMTTFRQFLPDMGMTYEPDDEDMREIIDSGLSASNFHALYKSLTSKEELQARIKTLTDNEALRAESDKQGMTGTVFHGLGDAVGDPTSYMGGPLGSLSKAGKLGRVVQPNLAAKMADTVIMAGVSESFLRNGITGEEADVTGAIAGAMIFTGGVHAAGKAFNRSQLRVEALETARNTNTESPTFRADHDGTAKMLDDDTELLESGLTASRGAVPPKASTSARFVKKDIATAIHQSNDEAVREMGSLFTNPTQGYKGEYRADHVTVEDMKNYLDMASSRSLMDVRDSLDAFTERSSVFNGKRYDQYRAEVSSTVYDAIEGNVDTHTLPKELQTVVNHIQDTLDRYKNWMENPSLLAGNEAPAMMKKGIEGKTYVPHQWRDDLVRDLRYRYGQDEAHRLLRESAMEGYRMDDANRAFNDAEIVDHFKLEEGAELTDDMVVKYYNDKTFGIIAEDAPMTRHANDNGEATSALDYVQHRMGVNTMGVVKAPDGSDFKLNDLLDKNIESILGSYSRAVNGRLSLISVTGMDEKALSKKINSMPDSEGKTALNEFMKVVKGTARTSYNTVDQGADLLRDVTYGLTNGKMGINGLFEMGPNMARSGYIQGVMRTVGQAFGKDLKSFTKSDIVEHVVDGVLGTHLTQRLNISYNEFRMHQAARMGKNPDDLGMVDESLVKARYGVNKAVQWAPQSRFVDGMQKVAIDAANNTAVSEMFASARKGFKEGFFSNDKFFKSNHIGDKLVSDAKGYIGDIQKAFEADGFPTDPNWLQSRGFLYDPRAASLNRLAYAYSDETVLKTNRAGQQYLEPLGAGGRLFFQFKRFSIGSSQMLSKTTKDIVQYRRLDQSMAVTMGMGTAFLHYASLELLNTMGMGDKERAAHLEKSFDPTTAAVGTIKRNNVLAFPSTAYDTLDILTPFNQPYAGLGRTTGDMAAAEMLGPKADSGYGMAQDFGGKVMSNIPSSRVAFAAGSALTNLGKYGYSKANPYAFSQFHEDRILREFARSFGRATVNNDPVSQSLYKLGWKSLFNVDTSPKQQ